MNKQQSKFNRQKALRHSNQESKRITRESVEVAFVDLLSKKEINKISISEITKRAGVSRSAFYRNYTSKEEILASISHHLLDYVNKYFQEIVTHKHNSFFYQEIFSKVRMEKRTFAIFIKTGILEKNSTKIMSFIDENLPYVS